MLIAAVGVVGGAAAVVTAPGPSASAPAATIHIAARMTAQAPIPSAAVKELPSAATATPLPSAGNTRRCAAEHGKYHGTVLRRFPVVGDLGAPKGERGGTLIVLRSATCGTVWAEVTKDGRHRGAYGTDVRVATYADTPTDRWKVAENDVDVSTGGVLSTKAVPALAHGRIEAEAGWAGRHFSFNSPLGSVRY
ncbi:hypothetical protein [Actinoallomurus rhizosphaericola]|uniref:hypothetical protein n=1 Tax=Actinoallomurus rhizosphaericola TaxID=2952536 RepID=UPI0020905305|nr:hypothetical protein [Actinoallomurus rhizosphaericola]MCO5992914.1 hypothetical protein [Actinoallomurus rhizosphaericola]